MKRVLAAGLALAMASTAACGGPHTSSPATVTVTVTPTTVAQTTMPPPVAPPPAEMGQWVTDGPLSFHVQGASAAVYLPSTSMEREHPHAPPFGTEIVYVFMTVKNTSTTPQTYRAADQMLGDDQGRLFAPTAEIAADMYVGRADLNPGTSHDFLRLEFAVAKGTDVSQYVLMVHGSPDSVGSPIQLHQGPAGDK